MIDIICYPDRSAAEWRDLLFAWVSIHAKRCDYGANFRNMTIHPGSTNTYRLKPKLASSNPALTLEPREFESHFKPFTFSKDYKQSPPRCLGHTTYFARNTFQASIGTDGESAQKKPPGVETWQYLEQKCRGRFTTAPVHRSGSHAPHQDFPVASHW